MNTPFFSVMVPVYNAEKYLNECFESIIEQDFDSFEVILIDDGSTDNSGVMCDDYAVRYPNVHVQHIENSGEIGARRACIATAQGEWVCFVDADDYYYPGALKKFYHVIQNYDTDIVIGRLREGHYIQPKTLEEYRQAFFTGGKFHVGVAGTAVRRSLYTENTVDIPRTVKKGPDFLINMRLSFRTTKVPRILDELIYYYRQIPTSIIATNPPTIEQVTIFKKHLKRSFPQEEYIKCLPYILVNHENHLSKMAYAETFYKGWQESEFVQEMLREAKSINYHFGWRVNGLLKIRSKILHKCFVTLMRIVNRLQA